MLASINDAPLKVLTPAFAERLRVFNQAARHLQKMGVRLWRLDPTENTLAIDPEAGRKLMSNSAASDFQRHPSAGSTRYLLQFEGVTLEWCEPISASRPDEWQNLNFNQGTLQ